MDANELVISLWEATEHYESDPRHARWDGAFVSFINATGLKPGLLGDAGEKQIRAASSTTSLMQVGFGSSRASPGRASSASSC
jgi:hypothetical protein